jgi:hypothetical protein
MWNQLPQSLTDRGKEEIKHTHRIDCYFVTSVTKGMKGWRRRRHLSQTYTRTWRESRKAGDPGGRVLLIYACISRQAAACREQQWTHLDVPISELVPEKIMHDLAGVCHMLPL